ncbi:unnamed protein product [Bursaphelenchus okinawaensis]|uniref:Late endosomal/lysosomal adaptor and MAPK and MTOR activator 4 n=1 Tax=Bursaphelenchus okinawaensis TaxID=465554 RepID=A0A811LTG6_9BILA|nr:unnamed protein product [Bursaphelenchus okinawaensis]CAG9128617.1 unnamed protein product [Bursaphelenchus okinawaensis]
MSATCEEQGLMIIDEGNVVQAVGSMTKMKKFCSLFCQIINAATEDALTSTDMLETITIAYPRHYLAISKKDTKVYVIRMGHTGSAEMFVNSELNTLETTSVSKIIGENLPSGDELVEEQK